MTKLVGKIISILLSIFIIITGVCLIVQCLSIYSSGEKPYSRDSVAAAFNDMIIPVIICISLLIISLIYNIVVKEDDRSKKFAINGLFVIEALNKKRDIYSLNDPSIIKERKFRRNQKIISTILLIIGFSVFGVYALNPRNFHQSEINESMIKAMIVFGICIIIPFIYHIISAFLNENSMKREVALLQKNIKDLPKRDMQEPMTNKGSVDVIIKIAALVICVAIILFGLFSGGTADVLTKAINICTECIGLG